MDIDFESYQRERRLIDLHKAGAYALKLSILWAALFLLSYICIWKNKFALHHIKTVFSSIGFADVFAVIGLSFIVMLLGIVLHELIHGFFFGLFAKSGFKSISFGFLPKYLAAYCHCSEPLLVQHYLLGALAPGIILGVVPSILALVTGSFALLMFGFFFTVSAVGDLMIVRLLKNENKNIYVLDHPSEPGCFILKPTQSNKR